MARLIHPWSAPACAAVVAAKPDVVVVSDGRNDASDYPATFATAATALSASLHARLTTAKLIVFAPFWGDSDYPPELAARSSATETAVQEAGGSYVALSDPLHQHPEYMSDGADPNDAGYVAIANAVELRSESFTVMLPLSGIPALPLAA